MASVTLKDLADQLKLSVSTVSRALNDSHEISEKTKALVRRFAHEMNYSPNLVAQSLKLGRTNIIGLIVPNLISSFQMQLLEGVQQGAILNNKSLIFMQSRENPKEEQKCINTLMQQNVDGIIISPCANSSIKFLSKTNEQIPLVLIDRIDYDLPCHRVGVDSERGAFEATKNLLHFGRKNILVLTGKNIGVSSKRLAGYKKAFMEAGLDYQPENVLQVDYELNPKDIQSHLKSILLKKLNQTTFPCAILSLTDNLTVYTLEILLKAGFRIPEQVRLVGFSNLSYAESFNPTLSSIVQPAIDMGLFAVQHVIDAISGKDFPPINPKTTILNPTVIFRES
ncbi:LacI family DNA-binding transcriptional regulator [Sphingobacterium sp. HJSM2_6]|uniref:LacI family DNA-binding transcriptional regulator n=1 Tax=Sphingobacterium sp. HJSM2_6 TaxID=3366264 RepID=UPI003BC917F6